MFDLSTIGVFDLTFISIITLSTLFGVVRGVIKSAVSLVGWMIAVVVALNFNALIIPYIEKYNFSHSASEVIAVIITFIIVAVIIAIINSIFLSLIKGVCGGLIDRSVGLTFGFARGCVIACVVFYALTLLLPSLYTVSNTRTKEENDTLPTWAQDSKSIILLARGSDIIASFLPVSFKRDLKESFKETVDRNEKQQAFSTTQMDTIRTTNRILHSLPSSVLANIPADDLLALQDSAISSDIKISVLNKITNHYRQYANLQSGLSEKQNSNQANQQYHLVIQDLEELITQYNATNSNTDFVDSKQ